MCIRDSHSSCNKTISPPLHWKRLRDYIRSRATDPNAKSTTEPRPLQVTFSDRLPATIANNRRQVTDPSGMGLVTGSRQ